MHEVIDAAEEEETAVQDAPQQKEIIHLSLQSADLRPHWTGPWLRLRLAGIDAGFPVREQLTELHEHRNVAVRLVVALADVLVEIEEQLVDAVRSMVIPTCFDTTPAGSWAGHRISAGTRMPPSQSVDLRWNRGALCDSNSPPLSLVKTTNVLRASCRRSSSVRISPTPVSARSTIAT